MHLDEARTILDSHLGRDKEACGKSTWLRYIHEHQENACRLQEIGAFLCYFVTYMIVLTCNWFVCLFLFFCGRTSLTARMKISMQTELICQDKSLIPKGGHVTWTWKAWWKRFKLNKFQWKNGKRTFWRALTSWKVDHWLPLTLKRIIFLIFNLLNFIIINSLQPLAAFSNPSNIQ